MPSFPRLDCFSHLPPDPDSNSVATLTEDVSVAGVLYLVIQHPIIAALVVIAFILFSIWFLKTMFRFLKKIFGSHKKPQESEPSTA